MNDDPATQDIRDAAETLFKDTALMLLEIARQTGITVKRMRQIMSHTQIKALDEEGLNRFEIMAVAGFSRRAIRLMLAEDHRRDRTDLLARFMGHWASDPQYPDELPIKGETFPSFQHLHDQYGSDFTAPGLLKVLVKRGLVEVHGDQVRALSRRVLAETPPEVIDEIRRALLSLLATTIHNLRGGTPRHLQRRLHSRKIPADRRPEARAAVRARTEAFMLEMLELMDSYEIFDEDGLGSHEAAEGEVEAGLGLHWFEIENPQHLIGDYPGHVVTEHGEMIDLSHEERAKAMIRSGKKSQKTTDPGSD